MPGVASAPLEGGREEAFAPAADWHSGRKIVQRLADFPWLFQFPY